MKLGVLLLNLGGPASLEEVEPFLFNLFSDPDTLPVPFSKWLQKPVARVIAKLRKPLSQKYYHSIGGGSPLKKITFEQAQALEEKLKGHYKDVRVFVGMQYAKPDIEEAWNEIVRSGRTHLVILPLYPQCSVATTGASIKKLKEVRQKNPYSLKQTLISSWYDHSLYLEATIEKITAAIQALPQNYRNNFDLVFSAHSLPMKFIEKGDLYEEQTKKTVELILKRLVILIPLARTLDI
ncbi:MAG: ferrochelatase [Deltaproteobacteria bacterium]|nr:ferrochelatase [Deltaproteobacteria bacterium]